MEVKCSCCGSGSSTMIIRDIKSDFSIKTQLGAREDMTLEIKKARICKVCGNIMPYVEPQYLHSLS